MITPEVITDQKTERIEIDSIAILDSIAKKDAIAKADSLAQVAVIQKAKEAIRKKKETPVISKSESPYKSLIFNVQLGISSKRKNWVLFEHGTYVVFPDGNTKDQMKNAAINLIKSFNNNPLTAQKSNFAKGWITSTSKGIYNYVAHNKGITTESIVIQRGKQNILKDKKDAKVIHINTK